MYEGRLKVILLLKVSSHDFDPTLSYFVWNEEYARQAQMKTNYQTFDMQQAS